MNLMALHKSLIFRLLVADITKMPNRQANKSQTKKVVQKFGKTAIIVAVAIFIADTANAQQTDSVADKQRLLEHYVSNANKYYKEGNYYAAIDFYNRAKEIYEFADLYSGLCLAYCAVKNEQKAKDAFKQYKRLAPKGEDIEKLKQALVIFKKPIIKWKNYPYQNVRDFWSINYSYSPYVPVKYNGDIYIGTTMQGVGISIMKDNNRKTLLKFETDISFYWGNIVLNSNGYYSGSSGRLYNVDIKFKGKFFNKTPQFQLGRNLVGRITGSFGGGLGWLSNTDMTLTYYYTPSNDDTLLGILMYAINNLSYQASIGMFFSRKDFSRGLKIEVFTQGYWQFASAHKLIVPQVGILAGLTFGRK